MIHYFGNHILVNKILNVGVVRYFSDFKVTDEKILAHYARLPGVVYVLTQHNDYDNVFRNSFPQHVFIAENEESLWLANRDPAL